MIDKQTLKKHNLKAVPFSCIGEGQWFYIGCSIYNSGPAVNFRRYLRGNSIHVRKSDGTFFSSCCAAEKIKLWPVYVPVWRVTEVVL